MTTVFSVPDHTDRAEALFTIRLLVPTGAKRLDTVA
jgi:hypothetical protein